MKVKIENPERLYFSSDHHFGHSKIIEYTNRPFSSVEEMDESLIKYWNEVVPKDGIVYHLGDIAFCELERLKYIVSRLNGEIHLICGNHDHNFWRYKDFLILERDVVQLQIKKTLFTLCHYPMISWPQQNHGSIHLHGHTHGTLQYNTKAIDVGVDCNNYRPYSLDSIYRKIK